MAIRTGVPYWRLSGFYFFYFAALGSFMPYWTLYLQSSGFDAEQIGRIMALLAATKLASPTFWGWLADHTDRSVLLIRISACMTAASFLLVDRFPGFAWMLWITCVVGLFWNAPLPLFEAVTLGYLQSEAHRYSRIRVWGSIGFVLAVLAVGTALKSALPIQCLPQLILCLFALMSAITLILRERSIGGRHGQVTSLRQIFSAPGVAAFFVVAMLVQLAHGPYYVFFSIHLLDNGYDSGQTGALWALGVVAEAFLFLYFNRLQRRFSARRILLASILAGALRWWLIAWFAQQMSVMIFAQLLHAASFGATHVVSVQLVQRYFGPGQHGKGQSLYSSLSFGLGGMLGSYYSGALWDSLGAGWVFSMAAAAGLLAALIVLIWVEKPPPGRRESKADGAALPSMS